MKMDLNQIFKIIDKDRNGTITKVELKEALEQYGEDAMTDTLMKHLDLDRDGQDAMTDILMRHLDLDRDGQDAMTDTLMRHLDLDRDGQITYQEYCKALDLKPDPEIIKNIKSYDDEKLNNVLNDEIYVFYEYILQNSFYELFLYKLETV